MVSTLGHALQTPRSAPTRSPFVDTCQWKPTGLVTTVSFCHVIISVSLCLCMSKHYFYPYHERYPLEISFYKVKYMYSCNLICATMWNKASKYVLEIKMKLFPKNDELYIYVLFLGVEL